MRADTYSEEEVQILLAGRRLGISLDHIASKLLSKRTRASVHKFWYTKGKKKYGDPATNPLDAAAEAQIEQGLAQGKTEAALGAELGRDPADVTVWFNYKHGASDAEVAANTLAKHRTLATWSNEEYLKILALKREGKSFVEIAALLPGRTRASVTKAWYTRIRKQHGDEFVGTLTTSESTVAKRTRVPKNVVPHNDELSVIAIAEA